MNQMVTRTLVLLAVIVTTNCLEDGMIDCTTSIHGIIQCSVSERSDDCLQTKNITGPYPLTKVTDLHSQPIYVDGIITRLNVTWKSPDTLVLNKTTGYVLRVYSIPSGSEDRVELMCRYLRITSTVRAVRDFNLDTVFTYLVSVSPRPGTGIGIEVLTLPRSEPNYIEFPFDSPVTPSTKSCGQPPGFYNNAFRSSISGTFVGDQAEYICLSRYATSMNMTIKCLPDQQWSTLPQCELPCEYPSENGYNSRILTVSGSSVGDRATYTCLPGYDTDDDLTIECRPGKVWSPPPPSCSSTCPEPLLLAIGSQMTSPRRSKYYEGSLVTYQCLPGSYTNDNSTIECLADHIWSPMPQCYRSTCPEPSLLANGSQMTSPRRSKYYEGSLVTYQCLPGYYANDNSTIECLADHIWSPMPQCYLIAKPTAFPSSDTTTPMPFNEMHILFVIPAVVIALVIAACLAIIRYRRRKHFSSPPSNACSELQSIKEIVNLDPPYRLVPASPSMYRNFSVAESELYVDIQPSLKICIVHSSSSSIEPYYNNIESTLSKILEKYFHCEVVPYDTTNRAQGIGALNSCDFLLVLCSSELQQTYKSRQGGESRVKAATFMTKNEIMSHSEVLNLLINPALACKAARIMITFEHLPSHSLTELQASPGNRAVEIYTLPKQLEQLVTKLCCRNAHSPGTECKVSTWDDYLRNHILQRQLKSDVDKLTTASEQFDSGYYDSRSLVTITTEQQMRDYELEQMERTRHLPAGSTSHDYKQNQGGNNANVSKTQDSKNLQLNTVESEFHSYPTAPIGYKTEATQSFSSNNHPRLDRLAEEDDHPPLLSLIPDSQPSPPPTLPEAYQTSTETVSLCYTVSTVDDETSVHVTHVEC